MIGRAQKVCLLRRKSAPRAFLRIKGKEHDPFPASAKNEKQRNKKCNWSEAFYKPLIFIAAITVFPYPQL